MLRPLAVGVPEQVCSGGTPVVVVVVLMTIPVCQYCLTAPEFAPGLCTVRRTERGALFASSGLRCQGSGADKTGPHDLEEFWARKGFNLQFWMTAADRNSLQQVSLAGLFEVAS